MNCREVMTDNPVCCLPSDTVSQAARIMRREDVGPVPVVNDDQHKQLIGIVTDRDLALKVVAESRDPNHTMVSDVMTSTIIACRETDDAATAIKAMEEHQIRRIPVVDAEGKIVGIISQADVATRIREPKKIAEVVHEISQAA
ncbi:MAG: CBS domain-containing protein [Acidobacteria bacterium]|nr:MAG: CBS domain-containing protein [Acidobacteriota bacterium]